MEEHEGAGVGGHDATNDLLNAHTVAVQQYVARHGDVENADGVEVHIDGADVQNGRDARGLGQGAELGIVIEQRQGVTVIEVLLAEDGENHVLQERLLSLILLLKVCLKCVVHGYGGGGLLACGYIL